MFLKNKMACYIYKTGFLCLRMPWALSRGLLTNRGSVLQILLPQGWNSITTWLFHTKHLASRKMVSSLITRLQCSLLKKHKTISEFQNHTMARCKQPFRFSRHLFFPSSSEHPQRPLRKRRKFKWDGSSAGFNRRSSIWHALNIWVLHITCDIFWHFLFSSFFETGSHSGHPG